jgi:hypothetical protein
MPTLSLLSKPSRVFFRFLALTAIGTFLMVVDPAFASQGAQRVLVLEWRLDPPFTNQDVDPPGPSGGDRIQAHFELTNRRGSANFACDVVDTGPGGAVSYLCTGALHLANGDLYAMVDVRSPEETGLIVGGTRAFLGAQGTFTQVENADGTGSWTIRLKTVDDEKD